MSLLEAMQSSLSEQLRDWLARAEILARGADKRRNAALQALERGRPGVAREHALAILEQLPHSPIALGLWADAAEALGLEVEAEEALVQLAARVPFRADIWLRLATARWRQGKSPLSELEQAAEAAVPTESADMARLWLADHDLDSGEPARAVLWLEQLSLGARGSSLARWRWLRARLDGQSAPDVADGEGAEPPQPLDGPAWLTYARWLGQRELIDAALKALVRAALLDAPRVERALAELVLKLDDEPRLQRVERLAQDLGWFEDPGWQATFLAARGEWGAALTALAEAARDGDADAAHRYLSAAAKARDLEALVVAASLAEERGVFLDPGIRALATITKGQAPSAILEALDGAIGSVQEWGRELRRDIYRGWLPAQGEADWEQLFQELGTLAMRCERAAHLERIQVIAAQLRRPLQVAIIGEFNAGKSSFINALLGEVVAPVGVIPTTATLNRLRWATDRFARIERVNEEDRVVPLSALASALRTLSPDEIESVTIHAPLEPLRRLELVDTPGFNSAFRDHDQVAEAALREAHVAIWVFDGTQALKASELDVLERLSGAGLPLVAVLNKMDRLSPSDAKLVAGRTLEELSAGDVPLLGEPVSISARQALAAKQGEAAGSEGAGWARVEELLERLVRASAHLRDRALRRAALALVEEMVGDALRSDVNVRRAFEEAEQRRERLEQWLARDPETISLGAVFDAQEAAFKERVRPLDQRADTERHREYLTEQGRAVLGVGLSGELAVRIGAELDATTSQSLVQRVAPGLAALGAALAPFCARDEAVVWDTWRREARELLGRAARESLHELRAEPPSPVRTRLETLLEVLRDAMQASNA